MILVIWNKVKKLKRRVRQNTMDITQLKSDVAALLAKIAAAGTKTQEDLALISKQLADLKAQVAAGSPATVADLQAIDDSLTTASAGIDVITSAEDALALPPAAPPAPPPATPPAA